MFAFAVAQMIVSVGLSSPASYSQPTLLVGKCWELLMDLVYEVTLLDKVTAALKKGTAPEKFEAATEFPAVVNTTTPTGRGGLLVLLRDLDIAMEEGQPAPKLQKMQHVIIWQTSFQTSTPRYVGVYWDAANGSHVFRGTGFLR